MAEVRQGVDALDRALVTVLAERQRYMDAAARIKPDRAAVRDGARIEDVVAKVKAAPAAGPVRSDRRTRLAHPHRPLHRPRIRGLGPAARDGLTSRRAR